LKLLGLLELLSKLWKSTLPDEFILGLSTDTPRTILPGSGWDLRTGLRPIRVDPLGRTGRSRDVLGLGLGFGVSREWRGRSSWVEELDERERRFDEKERESESEFSNGRDRDASEVEDDDVLVFL